MRQFPINSFLYALSNMSFPDTDPQSRGKIDLIGCGEQVSDGNLFICMDCDVDTNEIREYFMVDDNLWIENVPEYHGFLCIGCLEDRVGRTLEATDFPSHLPINNPNGLFFPHSDRLRDRLTTGSDMDDERSQS